ncbi:hypothetical protein ACS0TY_035881 [Phlomoides rotata]
MKSTECEDSLKMFIFEELKIKAEKAQTIEIVNKVCSARGEWVLKDLDYSVHLHPSISLSLSDEVEYDKSLLLWHIATEMCYVKNSGGDPDDREFSKVLSDYMLYLLVLKPTMMSEVAGIARVRYQDTCEEARNFFKRWKTELSSLPVDQREIRACENLLHVSTTIRPKLVKEGDRSESLLFDACILAKDLNDLAEAVGEERRGEERRWKMMSRIWVELLSYAAFRCRPNAHAQQLSQGAEFITLAWLLMLHFGLGQVSN